MAVISSKGAKDHHTYRLTLTQASQSVANNESTVNYSFDLIDDANWFWELWGNSITYSISANGSVIKSGSIPDHTTKNQNIASGSITVSHNTNGTKSFSFSFSVTDGAGQYYTSGNASASGSMTLTTIPRYANITGFSVTALDETSVQYNWSADATCDYAWCSTDNGSSWSGLPSNNVISGLSAGTSYNFKLRVRRTDSQLTTDSSAYAQSTYNYPHCTSSPDFTIGNALTLDFYNPLSRNISVKGYSKADGREIFNGTTNGTRLVGFNDENSVNEQYASIPNTYSSGYTVVVAYNNISMTRDAGNAYYIRGDEIPTINDINYAEGNDSVFAITNDRKHIVQNKSNLLAIFAPATANKGAGGISQYVVECNGKYASGREAGTLSLGTVDSERDVDLTFMVIDSRGLSATKSIKVTMLAHSEPTASVSLQRLNNYEDETYLTVDGSVSSVNGKNTMKIEYCYKLQGGSYNELSPIGDRETQTLSLDKNNVYIFNIVVTDAFGDTFNEEFTLDKGVFPLFIDTSKNSVGVNKFPVYDKSFEALGLVSLGERNKIELEVGESIEIPIFLSLCSGLVNFRLAGANLEVARLFYVFRSNQYFGLHKTLVDESYGNTSAVVPMEMRNTEQGYMFKITNNHSSAIVIRYGILELC